MKKIFLIIGLFMIGFLLPVSVFAAGDVKIDAIDLVEKGDNAEVKEDAAFEGLKVKFNVAFSEVNDSITYKVTVKNTGSKDYELSDDVSSFNTSEYVKYAFRFDNDDKVVKANSTKELFITISYDKAVDSTSFVDGKFVENNSMTIRLANDEPLVNPSTGRNVLLISVLVVAVFLGFVLIFNHQYTKALMVLVLFLIPVGVFALETIQIDIESKVEIIEKPAFRYKVFGCDGVREEKAFIEKGMSFQEYIESEYFKDLKDEDMIDLFHRFEFDYVELTYYPNEYDTCMNKLIRPEYSDDFNEEQLADYYDQLSEYENAADQCWADYALELDGPEEVIKDASLGYYVYNNCVEVG